MAGRIKIGPYKPLDVRTSAVLGGGYINVDPSAGNFGPSPWMQLGLQAAEGAAGIAATVSEHLANDNEAVVKAADVRLGEAEQTLLFDPHNGYLNTQGQVALTHAPAVLEAFRGAQDRELAGAVDDDQRQMLQGLNERRLADFTTLVERHIAAERQRWYDEAGERRIAQMQVDAKLHWSDDALLRRALGTTRFEVREKAEREGWDTPLTEAALRQHTSRILVAAIEGAIERDPDRAQSLRTRYNQHIEAADQAALDALLAEAQTRRRVEAASAEILNAAPPDDEQPTPQWRLRQAEAITEPAVRAATIRRVLSAAAETQAHARALGEQVLARVLKDGLTDPSQIPVREWVNLDAERRRAIETRLDHNAHDDEPAPSPALVDQLATQMTQMPEAFSRRDLVPLVAHLPLDQWQRFRNWQAGIRRNDLATEEELYAIKRGLQLATKMLPPDTDADIATNYRADLVEEIRIRRRVTGKSPDDAAIAEMLRQVELPSATFDLIQAGGGRPTGYGAARTPQQRLRVEQYYHGLRQVLQYNPRYTEAHPRGWVPSRADITRINEMAQALARAHSNSQINPAIRRDPGGAATNPAGARNRPSSEGEITPGWHVVGRAGGANLQPPQIRLPNAYPTRRNSVAAPGTDLHHPFPQQWWRPGKAAPLPFSEAARDYFDSKIMRVMRGDHWNQAHAEYNAAIETAMNNYFRDNPGITPMTMTAAQARAFYDAVVTTNPDPVVRAHLRRMSESHRTVRALYPMLENGQ